jgi:hypothetical protein
MIDFLAKIINRFIQQNKITSVCEFGCSFEHYTLSKNIKVDSYTNIIDNKSSNNRNDLINVNQAEFASKQSRFIIMDYDHYFDNISDLVLCINTINDKCFQDYYNPTNTNYNIPKYLCRLLDNLYCCSKEYIMIYAHDDYDKRSNNSNSNNSNNSNIITNQWRSYFEYKNVELVYKQPMPFDNCDTNSNMNSNSILFVYKKNLHHSYVKSIFNEHDRYFAFKRNLLNLFIQQNSINSVCSFGYQCNAINDNKDNKDNNTDNNSLYKQINVNTFIGLGTHNTHHTISNALCENIYDDTYDSSHDVFVIKENDSDNKTNNKTNNDGKHGFIAPNVKILLANYSKNNGIKVDLVTYIDILNDDINKNRTYLHRTLDCIYNYANRFIIINQVQNRSINAFHNNLDVNEKYIMYADTFVSNSNSNSNNSCDSCNSNNNEWQIYLSMKNLSLIYQQSFIMHSTISTFFIYEVNKVIPLRKTKSKRNTRKSGSGRNIQNSQSSNNLLGMANSNDKDEDEDYYI